MGLAGDPWGQALQQLFRRTPILGAEQILSLREAIGCEYFLAQLAQPAVSAAVGPLTALTTRTTRPTGCYVRIRSKHGL